MKSLILSLLVSLALSSSFLPTPPKLHTPTPQNLLDFLVGSLVSLQVLESIPDAFSCVTDLTNLQNNTQTALDLIKSGHFVDALHLLEQTFNQTYTSCSATAQESSSTFENFLSIVSDPGFLDLALQRLDENKLVFLENLALGLEQLNNGSYFNAGVTLGKIPHVILSGPDATNGKRRILSVSVGNTSCPVLEFLRGSLEVLKVWDNVPDAVNCLNDLATLKDAYAQVVSLISEGKWLEAIEFIEQTLKEDTDTCLNSVDQATKLFKDFLDHVSQEGFVQLAEGRIVDNVFNLIGEAKSGVEQAENGQWYEAGKSFGGIPHLILSGNDD